jgi:hypothetical protein
MIYSGDIATVSGERTIEQPAPRRRTSGRRAHSLTHVDKRTRLGRRIEELRRIFTEALGGGLSAAKLLRLDAAAQLQAIAEVARGDFMRDAKGSLDDIVRAERKADQAVRALGIVEGRSNQQTAAQAVLAHAAEIAARKPTAT